MNQEIHFLILFLSCVTYHAVAMTSTLPPDFKSPEERLQDRNERIKLGMECHKTCRPEQGTCHAEYPKSCTEYISCDSEKRGNEFTYLGVAMSCPHGTFFSKDGKTCVRPEQANCLFDQCVLDDNLMTYPSTSCKTYWQCVGKPGFRISTQRCCGANESYSQEQGKCVQDELCQPNVKDDCSEDQNRDCGGKYWGTRCQNECSKNCVQGKCDSGNGQCPCVTGWIGARCETACFFKEVPGDNKSYMHFNTKRPCGMGTVFSQEKCRCIAEEKPARVANNCRALVYTNFTEMKYGGIKNWQGSSYISYEDIEYVKNRPLGGIRSYGNFYGTGFAVMNFFSHNTKVADTFATRIVFRPGNGRPTEKQTLMSNCASIARRKNMQAPLDISLSPDSDEIIISTYTVHKTTGKHAVESFRLKYEPNTWNILDFLLKNNRMYAKTINLAREDIDDQTYPLKGKIHTGIGLHVGKCDYSNGFVGQMAEVTISLCDPGLRFASTRPGSPA